MARSFVAASTQYLGYLGLIQDLPFTVAGWARPTSSTDGGALFSLGNSANNNTRVQVMWYGSTSTKVYRARHVPDGGGAQDAHGTTGVALGDWSHWCATFPSASSRTIYTNGGNPVTNSTPVAGITTLDRSAVGTYLRATAVNPFDGGIAEVGVWYGTLDAGLIAELAAGKSPLLVSPQTLVAYWPLRGESPTSDERNVLAGYTLTQVASPAKADGPRIILPKRRQIFLGSSAGGGSTVDLAATAAAQSTATAALLKGVDLASAALSVSTGSAGMSLAVNLSGSAQAVASATGGLQVTVNLAAGALAAAVASAALAIGKPLAADGQGQATATADLSTAGSVTLAADAQAVASAGATLSLAVNLSASAFAVASAGAEFAGAVTLAADAIAQAQATAALSVGKPLAASAQGQAGAGATLTLQVPLGAAALAQAASTANLSLSVNLAAAAFGQATATAALPTLVELAASGLAMATASAALTVTAVNTTLGSLVGRLGRTVSSRPAAISNQVRHNRQTSSRR